MRSPAIAVSGLGAVGTLAPGLPVLQAIRSEPAFKGSLIGLAHDPLEPPNFDAGLLDRCYLIPYPGYGAPALWERIAHAHAQERIDAIIPTLDSQIPLFLELEDRLKELGIKMLLPTPDAFDLRSKIRLPKAGERTGLRVPHSRAAYNYREVVTASAEFRLPFLLKGHIYGASMVYKYESLGAMTETMIAKWGYPVVLQEYVAGEEYDVAALANAESELIGAIPMKKLQRDEMGKAWGGITVDQPNLVEATRTFVSKLGWRGPLELEVMVQAQTGEPYVIEVNPRFPAWIQLAVAAGQNLPWALARILTEGRVDPFEGYHAGVMSLRRSVDVFCPLDVYESLVTTGEANLRQLREKRPAKKRGDSSWVTTNALAGRVL